MKKLLKYLVSSIVQNPKEVSVEEQSEDDFLNLKVLAHPDDIKIIIGREGRTIRALRELIKIKILSAHRPKEQKDFPFHFELSAKPLQTKQG